MQFFTTVVALFAVGSAALPAIEPRHYGCPPEAPWRMDNRPTNWLYHVCCAYVPSDVSVNRDLRLKFRLPIHLSRVLYRNKAHMMRRFEENKDANPAVLWRSAIAATLTVPRAWGGLQSTRCARTSTGLARGPRASNKPNKTSKTSQAYTQTWLGLKLAMPDWIEAFGGLAWLEELQS